MNHIYRIVKNKKTGLWTVACEIARSNSGAAASALVVGAFGLTVLAPLAMAADPSAIPISAGTTASIAANKVTTVVNIATPVGSQLLSRNTYSLFNVDKGGLVLNNADARNNLTVNTQLAGQILANQNLTQSARVILNEVMSTNATVLNGFTEVAGSKADVLIANYNGITCATCGFINAGRTTLTTGVPMLNVNGGLVGLRVTQGQITVEGTGLNATGTDLLDLVARSIKLDGPVNATAIEAHTGAGDWAYGTGVRTDLPVGTDVGTAPGYAIDTSALGGMYANTIRLVASEGGIGVRVLGDVAAATGEFTLNAAGQIVIGGKISAATDLTVNTTVGTGVGIDLTNAPLSADQKLEISAVGANVNINGGQLYAGTDLVVVAASLTDAATDHPQVSNNQRAAGNNVAVALTGAAALDKTVWRAGNNFSLDAASLNVANAGTQLASVGAMDLTTAGAMTLGKAQLKSTGNLSLDAGTTLSTTAGDGQGVTSEAGSLTIEAVTFNNAGVVVAKTGTTLTAATLENTGTLVLSNAQGAGVTDRVTVTNLNNRSTGKLLSSGASNYTTQALVNDGTLQSKSSTEITSTTLTNNDKLILSLDAGGVDVLNVGTLTNNASGAVASAGQMNVTGTSLTNDGQMIAGSATIIESGAVTLGNAALLQTSGSMSINAATLSIAGENTRILGAMAGTAGTSLAINTTNSFSNPGTVYSGKNLTLSAPAITNTATGGIAANGNMTLTARSGDLYNYGALYASGNLEATATAGIYNYIQYHTVTDALLGRNGSNRNRSAGNGQNYYSTYQVLDSQSSIDAGGSISLTAPTVINSSIVTAGSNLTISAATLLNQVQDGDSRVWSPDLDFNHSKNNLSYYNFPNQYQRWHYTEIWHVNQYYANGLPGLKPQLTSGATLTLKDFSIGKNLGGTIQAPNVVIQSTVAGAAFTNDDLTLTVKSYNKQWDHNIDFKAMGPMETSSSNGAGSAVAVETLSTNAGVGASIKATTLTASGFALVNAGSPVTPSVQVAQAETQGTRAAAAAIPGLTLTLPKNPNGYFVANRDPSSKYLVETNPMFLVGGSTVGSEFLTEKLGINPTTTQKRLGDASYEAYLVQQQLVAQTGAGLLDGQENLASQMQSMMNSAVTAAGSLGLVYGQAPTTEQLANLTENIIWMVETIVEGQTVLAPVVYLAPSTVASLDNGAVISATKATMELTSLTNTGGTIGGSDSLSITATGDITNTSGTIKGGNVALTSTEGSIVNQTFAQGSGDAGNYGTTIGKTASIQSTGNLSLDAAKDIKNIGAQMAAGGDATLKAGENVTFDTIQDKTTTSTAKIIQVGGNTGFESSTTTTVNQVKSGLTVGGNLSASAAKDITLAGTDANIAGNAKLDAGGNLNIVARENTVDTKTESAVSGMGVGGGVYGMTKTNTESFSSRNVGTTLNVGGNADLTAGETMTVQGSKLAIAGDASITATDVKVLAGKDLDRTKTTTTTTSFLSVEPQGSSAPPEVASANPEEAAGEEGGGSGAKASVRVSASASASGEAEAKQSASAGVTAMKVNVTETSALSQRSVGSELGIGGNLTINAKKNVTLQGSEINAAGDVEVNAKNVELLAAQNIEQTSSKSTTVSIGLYASTNNEAKAQGSADASATAGAEASASNDGTNSAAGASADASAQAGAQGSANASSKNSVDIARVQIDSNETLDITNKGSAIKSGGNLKIAATESLRTVGSTIEAEKDINVSAKDMSFEAAQDTSYSKSSSSTTTMGLYLDAGGEAKGEAKAGAGAKAGASASRSGAAVNGSVSAEASAEAGAEASAEAKVGAGIQVKNNTTTTEAGSSTAVVSGIISKSGSISRTAENAITDTGTNIEAAGDFNQSAATISMLAATNSQFSKTTNEETVARIGVYVQGNAEAKAGAKAEAKASASAGLTGVGAEAEASAEAEAKAGAEVKVGVEATVDRTVNTESNAATQAVVSNIKVGGNVNTKSSGKTVLQGTNIDAAGDVNLSASELEVQAARDTETSTVTSEEIKTRVAVTVGVKAEAGAKASASTKDGASAKAKAEVGVAVGIEASASYDKNEATESSTTAVASNISGGGKININTTGSTKLEGTNLNAGAGVDISAKDLTFSAAQSTSSSSESSLSVSGEMNAKIGVGSDNSLAMQASMEKSDAQASGTEAVVGSINSGGGINIRTQENLRLEGTNFAAAGDTNISAGGSVSVEAARNTQQSSSMSVNASGGFDTSEASVNVAGGYAKSDANASQAVTSNISTGGALNISAGKDATFQGTNISAGGDAQIAAGGNVAFTEARDTAQSESSSLQVSLNIGTSDEDNEIKKTNTKTTTQGLSVDVAYAKSNESTAITGSIKAGNNLTVVAGGNATFVGTDIEAGNSAQVAAAGDVSFVAAQSTSESVSVGVSASVGSEASEETKLKPEEKKAPAGKDAKDAKDDKKDDDKKDDAKDDAKDAKDAPAEDEAEKESSVSASGSLDVGFSKSSIQKGSTIKTGAGGMQISSGNNVNLQGTQIETDGSSSITAAGSVNQTAAVSSSVGFSAGLSASIKRDTTAKDDAGGDDKKEPAADAPKAEEPKAEASKAEAASKDAAKPDGDKADAKPAEPEESKDEDNTGVRDLTLTASTSVQKTTVSAAGGSTIKSGTTPTTPIPGVSMTLRATVSSDGQMKSLVPVPGNLPAGTKVVALQPDGKPLPAWVTFDAATGALSGTPPADFTGSLNIVVSVPQADGTQRKVGVQFGN